jgi:DedD protein
MEVDGKEFLRNVGIEQDKDRLTQEQQKLEELKRASVTREQNYMDMDAQANGNESAFVDLSIGSDSPKQNSQNNNVEDILLDTSTNNDNKKKYIVLGFGLILLFIITVLVIRLISNSETENQLDDMNTVNTETVKEDILNKIDSNEEYQKVIDRKMALEESNEIAKKQKKVMNEILIPEQKIDNVPLVLDTPKEKIKEKRDLFELDKAALKVAKPIKREVKKVVKPKVLEKPKRQTLVPPAKEKNFTKNVNSLNGYFVQIGAFTKAPNKNLLKDISKKGYSYTVYQLMIKGRLYNKVLIGSYKNRADAVRKLNQIKLDFKNPNAYVLKF